MNHSLLIPMKPPILALIATVFVVASSYAATPARPNIVFILADDLGWGDVAFHGGNAPTPRLDKLAGEGLELTRHYVAPVCSPTRTGLLTGRCWSRFNVTTPQNARALPWDTVTLPRALKSLGYDTCLTGKWHLGSLPQEGPRHFGFDHSYGSLAGGVSPWNHRYKEGPFSKTWHRDEAFVEESGHVTDLIAQEAVRWIESRHSAPFFLYVPFTAVHLPVREPEAWLARVPQSVQGEVARHYAASIMHLDDAIGLILDVLDKTGHRQDTIVVFTSDNGGSWAENNDRKYPADNCPDGKLTASNKPWRGQKGELYEGGVRVPALVRWPGRVAPGKCDVAVQIIDWMPTFASISGYRPDHDMKWDGADLAKVLSERAELPPRTLYAVSPSWRARSVVFENWKLITSGNVKRPSVELFDLSADPTESTNLAEAQPERVRELQAKMDSIAARDHDAEAKD